MRVEDNTVYIKSWRDPVTQQQVPDPHWSTQDLHGQTFYVADSKTARVYCDGVEISSIKRNPTDFTGRQSITVLDDTTPTLVFDDVDFYEQNGRVIQSNASYFFQMRNAYSGQYSAEVESEADGQATVSWMPLHLTNTKPTACTSPTKRPIQTRRSTSRGKTRTVDFLWSPMATWPTHKAGPFHITRTAIITTCISTSRTCKLPGGNKKSIPRGQIEEIVLGMIDSKAGDSVFFDRIEFLSARGVRPRQAEGGLVVGGQLNPPRDGETVYMRENGELRQTKTTRGGWYLFQNVPPDAIVEIHVPRKRTNYFPLRGRVAQITKNDLEYHIFCVDPKSKQHPFNRSQQQSH